jgi:hypothetical protein
MNPTEPNTATGSSGAYDFSAGNGVKGSAGPRRAPALPVEPRIKVRRNQPCPCGSGKKAKKCCLPRIKALADLHPEARKQVVLAGILGHWPTVDPPAPTPVAVQQRFDELVAQQAAKTAPVTGVDSAAPGADQTVAQVVQAAEPAAIPITGGHLQLSDGSAIEVGPSTVTPKETEERTAERVAQRAAEQAVEQAVRNGQV